MKTLGDLKSWSDIQTFFSEAERRRKSPCDPSERKQMDALKRFRMVASHLIPDYDFEEPSLQRCLVAALDEERSYLKASENLVIQHETSKMLAFRYQAEKIFGEEWEDETDFATGLQKWMLRGLIPEDGVANLLIDEFEDFSEARQLSKAYESNLSQGDAWKPEGQKPVAHEELIQNWTNPSAPLWLMTNKAISKVIGEEELREQSVSNTLQRLGLKRLKQQPIRDVELAGVLSNPDLTVFSFSCASYVKSSPRLSEFLEAYTEAGRFTFTSDHFLRQDE
jgi:hypothetical protein